MVLARSSSIQSVNLAQAVHDSLPVTGNASEVLVHCLEAEGVEYIFGIPGEETLDLVEALRQSENRGRIKLILTRHEQSAGFMAAAIARLTDQTGVFLTTLGPGATNACTAMAHAQLAGIPLLLISSQKFKKLMSCCYIKTHQNPLNGLWSLQ